MSSPSRERRKFPRVRLLARTRQGSTVSGARLIVRDVSSGGFCLESSLQFGVGERHVFAFSQPGESPALLTAIVRHSLRINWPDQAAAYLTGFEFIDTPAQSRASIDRLLAHAKRHGAPAVDVSLEAEPADVTAIDP